MTHFLVLRPVVLGIFFFHIVLVTMMQTYALRYLYIDDNAGVCNIKNQCSHCSNSKGHAKLINLENFRLTSFKFLAHININSFVSLKKLLQFLSHLLDFNNVSAKNLN